MLAERVGLDHRREVVEHVCVRSERQGAVDPVLEGREVHVMEAIGLAVHEVGAEQVHQWVAAPDVQRSAQPGDARLGLAVTDRGPPVRRQALESQHVDRVRIEVEHVRRSSRREHRGVVAQRFPEVRDVGAQVVQRGRISGRPPQRVDQEVGGDRLPAPEGEQRQEGASPCAGDRYRCTRAQQLDTTEQPDLERACLRHRPGRYRWAGFPSDVLTPSSQAPRAISGFVGRVDPRVTWF